MATVIIERSRTARPGRAQSSPNAVCWTMSKKSGASLAAGNWPVGPVSTAGHSWPWMALPVSRRSSLVLMSCSSLRLRAFQQVHRAHAAATDQVGEGQAGALDLPPVGLAAQLQHRLVDHGQPGRAAGMAPCGEAAVGVERDAPARARLAVGHHALGAARLAEPEQLVVLELLVDERIVAVGDV